jgi:hypothetical protein
MNYFTKNYNRLKNSFSSSSVATMLLLLTVIIFLFNFNYDVFQAGAQAGPVTGQGTPGFISKWVTSSLTGVLTPASSSCAIASGASSCVINFSWVTINPITTSAVTSDTTNTGTAAPNTNVANGNNGGPVPFVIPYPGRNFYLYNNATLLDQKTSSSNPITATCISGTVWNSVTGKCVVGGGNVCQDSNANNAGGALPCTYNACLNGATNPSLCTINGSGACINGAVNPPTCTINGGGTCLNGATNPPTCNITQKRPVFIEN